MCEASRSGVLDSPPQLEHKFGRILPEFRSQIEGATSAELENWSDWLLDAKILDELERQLTVNVDRRSSGRASGVARKEQTMVSKALEEYLAEGQRRAELKSMLEGQIKGEAKMLLHLLKHKFGRIPRELRSRIEGATSAELEDWSYRLLDAQSLDEVFEKQLIVDG